LIIFKKKRTAQIFCISVVLHLAIFKRKERESEKEREGEGEGGERTYSVLQPYL